MAIDQTAAPVAIAPATATHSAPAKAAGGLSFRAVLSDINPLQYIPVVGALYRAATGDEGSPALRFVASLGTGFAFGGPVGVGITVAEKISGFDPEKIARTLLGHLFHHARATPTDTEAATMDAAPARPWTEAELSAYGSDQTSDADTLNALELRRLSATYA